MQRFWSAAAPTPLWLFRAKAKAVSLPPHSKCAAPVSAERSEVVTSGLFNSLQEVNRFVRSTFVRIYLRSSAFICGFDSVVSVSAPAQSAAAW
jgi:hypothetical protein